MKGLNIFLAAAIFSVCTMAAQPATGKGPYLKEAEIKETAGTIHILANSPRPLEQMVNAFHRKYQWLVDYEDPQFISKLDVTEIETPMKHVVPGGHEFSFEFPASGIDEEKTLRSIVDSYNGSENPGKFDLRKGEQGRLFVIGSQARNAAGQLVKQPILLDTPVTIVASPRTVSRTVSLICKQLALHEHIPVTVGILPRAVLEGNTSKIGGTHLPARQLLLQALGSTGHQYYWRLLFDPGTKGYVLDIHLISTDSHLQMNDSSGDHK